MATCEAFVSPSPPISLMKTQEIGRILGLPYGAAAMGPIPFGPPTWTKG